jgi:sugar/nucleoside kinase (ribokinase family)
MIFRHSQKKYDIICLGKTIVDIIFNELIKIPSMSEQIYTNKYTINIGGGAAITAIGFNKFLLKTALVSSIGNDLLGKYIYNTLKKYSINLNCFYQRTGQTDLSIEMSFPLDRATTTALFPEHEFKLNSKILNLTAKAKHIHIVSQLNDDIVELLKYAIKNNITTSIDPDLVMSDNQTIIMKALPYIDLLLPSCSEILGWNGLSEINEIVLDLGSRIRKNGYCVVKLGEQGSMASDGVSLFQVDAYPASVVDTTGAGDAFNVGFIYGFLKKKNLISCMKLGNAMGSLNVRKIGGIVGMPSINELENFIKEKGINLKFD